MFGLFKSKKPAIPALIFKNNAAAFEYACKYLNCDIAPGNILVGLIEEASANQAKPSALLRISTADGGKTTVCPVVDSVPPLTPGDLVAFKIFDVAPGVKSVFGIQGAVVAKLAPEHNGQGWKVVR